MSSNEDEGTGMSDELTITDWTKLGGLVRDARRRKGLSQIEVASRAEVARSWLSKVEAGHRGAELAPLLRLFKALDLNLSLRAITPAVERTLDTSSPMAPAGPAPGRSEGAGPAPAVGDDVLARVRAQVDESNRAALDQTLRSVNTRLADSRERINAAARQHIEQARRAARASVDTARQERRDSWSRALAGDRDSWQSTLSALADPTSKPRHGADETKELRARDEDAPDVPHD